ncbi:MAG: hypothetical protein ACFBSD_11215 [Paracoccaceae bacterium]
MEHSFSAILPLRRKARLDAGEVISALRLFVEQTGATVRIDPRMANQAEDGGLFGLFGAAKPEIIQFELDGVRLRVATNPEPFKKSNEIHRFVNPVMWNAGLGEFADHRAHIHVYEAGIEGEEGPDATYDRAAAVTATAAVVARLTNPVGAIWASARNALPVKTFEAAVEKMMSGTAPLSLWLRWHIIPPGDMDELSPGLVTHGLAAFAGREVLAAPSEAEPKVMVDHAFGLARRLVDEKIALSDNQLIKGENGDRLRVRLRPAGAHSSVPLYEIVREASAQRPDGPTGPSSPGGGSSLSSETGRGTTGASADGGVGGSAAAHGTVGSFAPEMAGEPVVDLSEHVKGPGFRARAQARALTGSGGQAAPAPKARRRPQPSSNQRPAARSIGGLDPLAAELLGITPDDPSAAPEATELLRRRLKHDPLPLVPDDDTPTHRHRARSSVDPLTVGAPGQKKPFDPLAAELLGQTRDAASLMDEMRGRGSYEPSPPAAPEPESAEPVGPEAVAPGPVSPEPLDQPFDGQEPSTLEVDIFSGEDDGGADAFTPQNGGYGTFEFQARPSTSGGRPGKLFSRPQKKPAAEPSEAEVQETERAVQEAEAALPETAAPDRDIAAAEGAVQAAAVEPVPTPLDYDPGTIGPAEPAAEQVSEQGPQPEPTARPEPGADLVEPAQIVTPAPAPDETPAAAAASAESEILPAEPEPAPAPVETAEQEPAHTARASQPTAVVPQTPKPETLEPQTPKPEPETPVSETPVSEPSPQADAIPPAVPRRAALELRGGRRDGSAVKRPTGATAAEPDSADKRANGPTDRAPTNGTPPSAQPSERTAPVLAPIQSPFETLKPRPTPENRAALERLAAEIKKPDGIDKLRTMIGLTASPEGSETRNGSGAPAVDDPGRGPNGSASNGPATGDHASVPKPVELFSLKRRPPPRPGDTGETGRMRVIPGGKSGV